MPLSDWHPLLADDYPNAAIRLTTLEHEGAVHLLFGYVELLPAEIPPPNPYGAKALNLFNGARARTSVTVMPTADAIAWYEWAASGELVVPGAPTTIRVQAVQLGAEPMLGRFTAAAAPPVAASWHALPRINRLVPMDALPPAVIDVLAQPEGSERRLKMSEWLEANVFVDLCRTPDCAGGLLMLAPNPVLRSCNEYRGEAHADGRETIRIKALPRAGYPLDTLSVRLREQRPDGTSILEEVSLDQFGAGEFTCPERVAETGLEITCAVRGLLSIAPLHRFLRAVRVNMRVIRSQTDVEVPGRKKGEAPSRYSVSGSATDTQIHVGEPDPPPSGEARLAELLAARTSLRTGVFGEKLFAADKTAAVSFVRSLVWPATKRVIFVDPYFNETDVREFALGVSAHACPVTFLTGRTEPKWSEQALHLDLPRIRGEVMYLDMQHINSIRQASGSIPIVGKVMGGEARHYHDRFLIIDDAVWHFGTSFNSLADGSVSMAMRLEDPAPLLAILEADLAVAETFEDYWLSVQRRVTQSPDPGTAA